MDDYNIETIIESKNEWCARLTNILTPCIIKGINSILDEAYKLCIENDEESKYLMTFQNLLNNIPKWSSQIIDEEKNRIITQSTCNYLDDLLTCVHITQLKSLTCSRVGLKQKKVNIDIPNLNAFIHKTYINCARKVYVNVYLFEKDIMPLQIQKNNRELELIVKECILNTIRENVPVENILRTYLDETQETDVEVEEKKESIIDKEAIARETQLNKEKELEKIKKEVREKINEESKNEFNKLIKDANKDINKAVSKLDEENKNDDTDSNYLTDEDIDIDIDNSELNDKLVIDSANISEKKLDINHIDKDIDVLDLDSLKINDFQKENDEITLDIEEL
jgi:hypothetical protein